MAEVRQRNWGQVVVAVAALLVLPLAALWWSSGDAPVTTEPAVATRPLSAPPPPRSARPAAVPRGLAPSPTEGSQIGGEPDEELVGRVVDPLGRAVDGAEVRCGEETAISDARGAFVLPPAADGCEAQARHPGYAASSKRAMQLGVEAELQLAAGGQLLGRVEDAEGVPVPSFSLAIESFVPADRDGGAPFAYRRDIADPEGRFVLEGLAAGHYVVAAATEGAPPARVSVAIDPGRDADEVVLVLPAARSLSGRVEDATSGEALAGVRLSLEISPTLRAQGQADAWPRAQAITGEDGTFSLRGLPTDRCTLRLHLDGYRSKRVLLDAEGAEAPAPTYALTPGPGFESVGVGIGLKVSEEGAIRILAVLPDSPAGRAGLNAGDRLETIDGEAAEVLGLFGALRRLWGPPQTSVRLAVEQPRGRLEVELEREALAYGVPAQDPAE